MQTYFGCCPCVRQRNCCSRCNEMRPCINWQNSKLPDNYPRYRIECCYIHHNKLIDDYCCIPSQCRVCTHYYSFFFPGGQHRAHPNCCCKHYAKSLNYEK